MFLENEGWEGRTGLLAPPNTSSGAFFAKFEKTAPAVTGTGPRIFPGCVVNAASYVGGGVVPGEIVTLFGSAMGPSELNKCSIRISRSDPESDFVVATNEPFVHRAKPGHELAERSRRWLLLGLARRTRTFCRASLQRMLCASGHL
jgi:hypothetical protein